MSAMFPGSGVPAADAKNSLPDAQVNSLHCDELWYSTSRCQPRFDPAAANAMLAEIINVIMQGEVVYDCDHLDRLQLAIRYLIQRGIPKFGTSGGAPNLYEVALSPAATRYNNGMELVIVPHQNNTGPAWVNINGIGWVQVLRGNGTVLSANDMRAQIPLSIAYWNGNFFVLGAGIVRSDIPNVGTLPRVLTGDLDAYVDWQLGNDATGDGTPANPFQTINGCWTKLGALYIASPIYAIRIHLVRAGDHAGCFFSGYGGRVEVIGNEATKANYRIMPHHDVGSAYAHCAQIFNMTSLKFTGVSFVLKGFPPVTGVQQVGISVSGGNVQVHNCHWSVEENAPLNNPIWTKSNAVISISGAGNEMYGNNNQVAWVVLADGGDFVTASGEPSGLGITQMLAQNHGFAARNIARIVFVGMTLNETFNTGPRYISESNSVISLGGNNAPGDSAGTVLPFGIYI